MIHDNTGNTDTFLMQIFFMEIFIEGCLGVVTDAIIKARAEAPKK